MTLEFERIELLQALFSQPKQGVRVSVGDDCAVLEPIHVPLAVSVDTSIENVHFRFSYASLSDIGFRAYVAALSDLAAVGAVPHSATVALAFPISFDESGFRSLVAGIKAAADHYEAPVIGGNLSKATELSITTTVFGTIGGRTLLRSGAQPGDSIWVTGNLGGAALGLAVIEKGLVDTPDYAEAVSRWRHPHARIAEGISATTFATAAIDISDGLLQDLGNLCAASKVGARVFLDRVPTLPNHNALAHALGVSHAALTLAGGEDYELLFTAPSNDEATKKALSIATRIGEITDDIKSVEVTDAKGNAVQTKEHGFDHFRR